MQILYEPGQQRIPIKAWLDINALDEGTVAQARNLARLPFAHHHVALMPDAHHGYGMPIGGVLAADGYVVPNAIGVDIGCGMHARRTNIEAGRMLAPAEGRTAVIRTLLDRIHQAVPTGNGPSGSHRAPQQWDALGADSEFAALLDQAPAAVQRAWERCGLQLGTLGGGNHFIEVQADEDGFVLLMLHSGSRALGKEVCDHFNAVAPDLNERFHSSVVREAQLPYLPLDSDEGRAYLAWMRVCMAYALENRRRMLGTAVEALFDTVRGVAPDAEYLITEAVDTRHNYADAEHHFGADVLVHRKGAVRARAGEMVIIPGWCKSQ